MNTPTPASLKAAVEFTVGHGHYMDANYKQQVSDLANLLDAQRPQWMPIETAPRGGTWVLLTNGLNTSSAAWKLTHHGFNDWLVYPSHPLDSVHGHPNIIFVDPTHWQPLPPPPSGKQDGG